MGVKKNLLPAYNYLKRRNCNTIAIFSSSLQLYIKPMINYQERGTFDDNISFPNVIINIINIIFFFY